jgi:multiple sugar transport system permease protein
MRQRPLERILLFHLPLWFFLFVTLFPFLWMFITSIKPNAELYNVRMNPLYVLHPTLEHFRYLLRETIFLTWAYNTLYVSILSTAISLITGIMAGYALSRLRFRGAGGIAVGIFVTYLVPPTLLFIPLANVVRTFGLLDSPWSLILTYPTFLIPFCTWLLMGYFVSVPVELEEAGLVDGCSRLGVLFRIVMPVTLPALAVTAFFSFTLSWNEYLYASVFVADVNAKTIPTGIPSFIIEDVFFWGPMMASTVLSVIPPLGVYFIFQRWLITGLTLGAVKG